MGFLDRRTGETGESIVAFLLLVSSVWRTVARLEMSLLFLLFSCLKNSIAVLLSKISIAVF